MNLGIKGKLLTLTCGMLGVFLMATTYAVFKVSELREQIELLGLERMPLAETLADMQISSHAAPLYVWVAMASSDGSEMEKNAVEKMDKFSELLVASTEKFATFNLMPESRQAVNALLPDVKQVKNYIGEAKKLIIQNTPATDAAVKKLMINEMAPVAIKLSEEMDKLDTIQNAKNREIVKASQEKAKTAQASLIVLCFLTVAVSLGFGIIFATNLAKQLLSITDQVGDASEQVSSASGQLSASASELSNSAQEQAAAVEEASASLTEIAGMIDANVKNSDDSKKLTVEVYAYTEETKLLMNELTEAMNKILESNVKIENLAKVIEEVGVKTEVIDDIVFKTQLLSFNASVEAERAGEHGRGFAVVAQEVGNLALMSGKAANEISAIVKTSIKEADEIARENKTRVENGGKLATIAYKKMTDVLDKISQIQGATAKVAEASREQSQGINQITTSVESINQTTQETASTSEEAASASEELSSQSEALLALVNNMKTLVTGDSNHGGDVRTQHAPVNTKNKKITNVINFAKPNSNRPKTAQKTAMKHAVGAPASMGTAEEVWEKF